MFAGTELHHPLKQFMQFNIHVTLFSEKWFGAFTKAGNSIIQEKMTQNIHTPGNTFLFIFCDQPDSPTDLGVTYLHIHQADLLCERIIESMMGLRPRKSQASFQII